MRAYAQNALPTDAAFYVLNNASIANDQITFGPAGGSASITLTKAQLSVLTEYMKINVVAAPSSDEYDPELTFTLYATSASGEQFTHVCNISYDQGGIYVAEVELINEEYSSCEVIIESKFQALVTLWELCPLAEGNVETIIDGVKQSLPRLLYDYNTTRILVGQSENIVGVIPYYLQQSSDLQGHFLLNFIASERCSVHLRFYDNEVTELFSPIVTIVEAGYNTIQIPHAWLQRAAGIHNAYVTAQCTNGELSVTIRGVLFTIDGGYLASRIMDPGMDVTDITIRQLPGEAGPSEIWAIGIDNGRLLIKKRPYQTTIVNPSWDFCYDLGEGRWGAIEFNGNWVRRDNEGRYTIITENIPYMAYTDNNNTLWCIPGDLEAAPIQIAENVTQFTMVRGFKSNEYPDQDQGFVICWVSQGNVYYKRFAYFAGEYIWLSTVTFISTGTIAFAQIHRLNDYRLGIITQDTASQENIWYLTDRTFVAQAAPPELMSAYLGGPQWISKYIEPDPLDTMQFVGTQNVLEESTVIPSEFTITFDAVDFIYFESNFERWRTSITILFHDEASQEVSVIEEYALQMNDGVMSFVIDNLDAGELTISWGDNCIGCLTSVGAKRVITTQEYHWQIRRVIPSYPELEIAASLEGDYQFQKIYPQHYQAAAQDISNLTLAGTQEFLMSAIGEFTQTSQDISAFNMSGTQQFSMTQSGSTPV